MILDDRQVVVDKIDLLIENLVNLKDASGKYMRVMEDGTQVDQVGFEFWEWISGIGLYGMMKYYQQTKKTDVLERIIKWYDDHLPDKEADKNINTMVQMLTLSYVYEVTGNEKYLPYLISWSDWLYNELPRTTCGGFEHMTFGPRRQEQLWNDTLMMGVLTLAKIGMLLGNADYVEEAKYQFMLHIQFLADVKTGLWYHGWTFHKLNNFSRALWARGNAWITIAIPEFLELVKLPDNDAVNRFLTMTLKRQMDSLKRFQCDNGMWHTLLIEQTSYMESSSTAGFSYGILKAVHNQIAGDDYREMGIKAAKAILRNIDANGALKYTSMGTEISNNLEDYRNVPQTTIPSGQALAILCLCEYLKEVDQQQP